MRDCCEKVIRYTSGMTLEDLKGDEKTFDAVMRNLEITGEAVRHIPAGLIERYPEVQWRRIAGFRDVAIHAYPTVDEEIVWDIITNKVPELATQIDRILRSEPGS